MPYELIDSFRAGLDRRDIAVAAPRGTLQHVANAHINRGGEIQKRKAFAPLAVSPAESFGLAATKEGLWVFGSGTTPAGLPEELQYQRLQHPDGFAMTGVIATEIFNGKIYAVAKYADGAVIHFYNGKIVPDWIDGIARADLSTNSAMAAHLNELIQSDNRVNSTVSGNVLTLTTNPGKKIAVAGSVDLAEGNPDGDANITFVNVQNSLVGTPETVAVAEFQIHSGKNPTPSKGSFTLAGTGIGTGESVDTVTVNSVNVLGTAVNFATDLESFAAAIATQITNNTSSPDYTADSDGATVNIYADRNLGSDADGLTVDVATTGANLSITDKLPTDGGVIRALTQVSLGDVNLLQTGRVNFNATNIQTAFDAAAKINESTANHKYTALAQGEFVTITAEAGTGSSKNSLTLNLEFLNGTTETGPSAPPVSTPAPPPPPPPPPPVEEEYEGGGD